MASGEKNFPPKTSAGRPGNKSGKVVKTKKGLTLFYCQQVESSRQCRLGALLLNSEKPTQVIREEKLWEGEWGRKVSFGDGGFGQPFINLLAGS